MRSSRYVYIKQQSLTTAMTRKRRKMLKLFSVLLIFVGIFLMVYVVSPILSWQIFYAPILSSGNILSPIPQALMLKQNALNTVLASSVGFDSTLASQWFPIGNPKTSIKKEYFLSISKLGIKNATVSIGSDDLAKSLIHYGGSSLPGEYGNAVVFGHSVLPQFFDSKNYKTIFSTLHTLKTGDRIEISYDNILYKYKIFDFKVVDPTEISVLEQTYDNAYITLITCTPPGTYWKRLVIKAKIEKV